MKVALRSQYDEPWLINLAHIDIFLYLLYLYFTPKFSVSFQRIVVAISRPHVFEIYFSFLEVCYFVKKEAEEIKLCGDVSRVFSHCSYQRKDIFPITQCLVSYQVPSYSH